MFILLFYLKEHDPKTEGHILTDHAILYAPLQGAQRRMVKWFFIQNEPRRKKTVVFAYAKTKTQISFAVTAKLISAFVFAT